ncbi:DUF2141 domain-containing protein [bacterium]|nr:DUF2141 domain-containing protein [bacterium]
MPVRLRGTPSESVPYNGYRRRQPPKSGSTLSSSFGNIPPGGYAIFAFQDSDHNGTLNLGLFGPTEPWGTYRHVSSIPTFSAMVFRLSGNRTGIKIKIS